MNNVVAQIKVLNLGVELGDHSAIHYLKYVEGDVLVTPKDFEEDELVNDAQA